ncbi:MAG: hypothetical protein M3P95_13105, partial [Actinomycetota bacterium]|nr:hypothetical protein [Actinomycetota bacterium]
MPRPAAFLLACTLPLAACQSDAPDSPQGERSGAAVVQITSAPEPLLVPGQDADQVATATSELLWQRAPLVVLAPPDDEAQQAWAAAVAVGLGAPLLLASTATVSPDGAPGNP